MTDQTVQTQDDTKPKKEKKQRRISTRKKAAKKRAEKIAKPATPRPRKTTKPLKADKYGTDAKAFIGMLMAAWKREKGLTIAAIGELVNAGNSRIQTLVKGHSDSRLSSIAAVAREGFGVDLQTFIVLGIAYQEKHQAEDRAADQSKRAKALEHEHGVTIPSSTVSADPS